MGAREEAPPRVHTRARPAPAPAPAPAPLLRGRANTLNVLSLWSEVTRRPRAGHAAMPNPFPQWVLRAGSGRSLSRPTPRGRGGGATWAHQQGHHAQQNGEHACQRTERERERLTHPNARKAHTRRNTQDNDPERARNRGSGRGGDFGVGAQPTRNNKEATKRCTSPTSTPTNSTSTTQGEAQPPTHSHRTHPSTHENTHAPLLPRAHQNCNSGTHKESGAHASQASKQAHPAPMQRRHVPLPQKNSSGGTHRRTTRGERGASQRQVGAHTPTRKNKASNNAANARGTARLRLPHPNTQENDPKEWQIQQCRGRVSW